MTWVLRHHPSISPDGHGGMSPLHVACKSGQTGVVKVLLAAGARVTVLTKDKAAPVHFAAQCTRGAAALAVLELLRYANVK